MYDGFKYLHRAYERYRKEKIEEIDPFDFVVPGYENNLRWMNSKEPIKTNFYSYADLYLARISNNIGLGNAIYPIQTPMDLLFEQFDLGGCEEKIVCF